MGVNEYDKSIIKIGYYGSAAEGTHYWQVLQNNNRVFIGDKIIDEAIYTIGEEYSGLWDFEEW